MCRLRAYFFSIALARPFAFFISVVIIFIPLSAFAEKPAKALRIASINLCADALLLKLVDSQRINSLYYLSANPQFSAFATEARKYHLNHGLAEELVPLNPDLILAGEFSSAEAKTLLKQLGFRVEELSLPRTLDDINEHIRLFGQLTNTEHAANIMAKEIEQKLAWLDGMQKVSEPVPAFWYSSNGVVVGGGTVENELMTRAGFRNLALDKNINGFAQIDLEELILSRPKAIIVDSADVQAFSLASEYVQHPALRKSDTRIISLPTTLSCIAPVVADTIQHLMEQKRGLTH